ATMVELMRARGYSSFVVICHDGDATTVSESSLAGTGTDSWGNIIFFSYAAHRLFERVVRHADWRLVLEMSGQCNRLRAELRGKEAVIRVLDAAVHPKEGLLRELDAALANKEKVIQELD